MTKFSKVAMLAAVGAVAAVPMTAGAETPRDSARGGGQVLLDPNANAKGALDTIAFQAQRERGATDESGLADGQLQVNRRNGDTPVKFHGEIECLIVVGNKAYISGVQKNQEEEGTPFELYIEDGGQTSEGKGADSALVWYGAETEENEPDNQVIGNFTPPQEDSLCGIEEDPRSKREIPVAARGNYKVNDYTAPSARRSSSRTALSLR